jgi:glucose/mannose-6-phosphate isomerase
MYEFIEAFPDQLLEASKHIVRKNVVRKTYSNILFCGLGGSGIVANMISDLFESQLNIPIIISKGYSLPTFLNDETLLIIGSYSGNTEEAINCFQTAIDKDIKPICISSGGKLTELANAHNCDLYFLPKGYPPRASLAFGFIALVSVLENYLNIDFKKDALVYRISEFLSIKKPSIKKSTENLASKFKNQIVVLYIENQFSSLGLRIKQQINENSKSFCWYNEFPEFNHNEIVGLKQHHHQLKFLFLRTSFENERNILRFGYLKSIIEKIGYEVIEVKAEGNSKEEQYFYLLNFGDWLSYFIAQEQKEDAIEVKVIDGLKNYLNSVS